MRKWRNWQTRRLQVPVVAIPCGFKSRLPHSSFCKVRATYNFIFFLNAEVAELADAQASGACGSNTVRVQVPPSALFIFCLKNSQSRLRVLFFYTLHDARVLCASGTCLAPTEAERRKDCGSATHGTFMSQTSARYK